MFEDGILNWLAQERLSPVDRFPLFLASNSVFRLLFEIELKWVKLVAELRKETSAVL